MMKSKHVIVILLILLVLSLVATYTILATWKGFEFWHNIDFDKMENGQLFNGDYERNDINEMFFNEVTEVEKLSINATSTDIYVTFSEDENIEVALTGSFYGELDKQPLSLKRNVEDKNVSYEVEYENSSIFSFVKNYQVKLYVSLPKKYHKMIYIDSSSGNIVFENDNEDNSAIKLLNTSGNIHIKSLSASTIDVESSSGNIVAYEVIAANQLEVTSISGNIEIENIKSNVVSLENSSGNIVGNNIESVNLTLKTVSGDATISDIIGTDATLSTSTGNMRVNDMISNCRLKSISGDVSIAFPNELHDCYIDSSSGNVRIDVLEDGSFSYECNTSSGNFSLEFETLINDENEKHHKGTVKNGNHVIAVTTSSGDIRIRKIG